MQQPEAAWGQMLAAATPYVANGRAWWFMLYPGLALFITVLGFNLLGDGLRDALDPTLPRLSLTARTRRARQILSAVLNHTRACAGDATDLPAKATNRAAASIRSPLLMAISPFVLFMAGTLMAHTANLFLFAVFLWACAASLDTRQVRYALICDQEGGILDDVLVYRLADAAAGTGYENSLGGCLFTGQGGGA